MIGSIQRPFEQATPPQQSAPVVQSWPYSAQPGVLASKVPASVAGGVPGGSEGVPQIPCVEPMRWMQVDPILQSPPIEHGPPAGTQAEGGTPLSSVDTGGA